MSGKEPSAPMPQFIAAFNFQGHLTGVMMDLAHGVGPVIAHDSYLHDSNKNKIWSIFSVPNKETFLIRSEANQQWLVADGHGQRVRTDNPSWFDESAQWVIRGVDIHRLTDSTTISIMSVKYPDCALDVEGGNDLGSHILTYKYHGGHNQTFRLLKRW
ncbi:hypothetical protein FPOAC2_03880 [Fusarium poae]|uniref:Ricin B lectin domain-containing protein n=1 Tax=Fusarium poae TaxID=36050 RepID=A0A1B8BA77_FUSPO|nr:hypothetical protein FPOAC1_003721 [Fusarium poae]KAG8677693.1 hypothetical protein FPOAC1_003721 [Fusarium poae]OBS29598.1 hypothetical protein FPOA_03535 [Fusarium poae]